MWEWSVRDLENFWTSIAEHFDVKWQVPPETGRSRLDDVAGAVWFPGSRLNYAANVLRLPGVAPDDIVVRAYSETRPPQSLTATQLRDTVTRVAAGLRRLIFAWASSRSASRP
ncbi:acetyl-coenzyme A synthetase N-terminal domain-containing protein [Actinomadura rugatobispora]|uniref:Acetyl-coenzyme A synthetase N-terminal domain-containing protein n=1 Tax=Actinomadura rugatobispora TaxID=1994 RepID=A0ABW1A7E8_9ACTN